MDSVVTGGAVPMVDDKGQPLMTTMIGAQRPMMAEMPCDCHSPYRGGGGSIWGWLLFFAVIFLVAKIVKAA